MCKNWSILLALLCGVVTVHYFFRIKIFCKVNPPRISLKTLQKTKDKGGLDLPNFYHYFLANRLQHISGWLKHTLLDEPWLDVEQALCNNIEISDLPFISSISKRHVCFKSISISSSLTAWWEFLKMTESSLIPCKRTPSGTILTYC